MSPGFTLCPIVVSVDDHNLTMIASDGAPFKPQQVQSFIVHPGERCAESIYDLFQDFSSWSYCVSRYDFILTADQPPANYLLRAAGLFDCSATKAHSVARIHYRKVDFLRKKNTFLHFCVIFRTVFVINNKLTSLFQSLPLQWH